MNDEICSQIYVQTLFYDGGKRAAAGSQVRSERLEPCFYFCNEADGRIGSTKVPKTVDPISFLSEPRRCV